MNTKQINDLPIGIFDSGIGGLTVMQKVREKAPNEKIIYFGDTARLPYGGKSSETILRYSIENTILLLDKDIKMLVIACNTAASYSAERLKSYFNIPIVDVVEAGVAQVVATSTTKKVGILGTKGTISSGVYQKKIADKMPGATIAAIACPLFTPLVEEGFTNHQATKYVIAEYLAPLKELKVDTVLLGCTHYPLLLDLIADELGPNVQIVDSATACAEKVDSLLLEKNIEAKNCQRDTEHKFYVSDDPERFGRIAKNFLEIPVEYVEKLSWHH